MSSYTLPWTAVRGCQWASPQRRRTPRLPAEGDPEQMCRPIGRLRPIGVSIPFSCFNMFQFRLADRRATLGRKQARCISRHIDTDETDQSVHFNLTVQSRLYPDTFDHVCFLKRFYCSCFKACSSCRYSSGDLDTFARGLVHSGSQWMCSP